MTPTWLAVIIIALFAACAFTAIWSRRDTPARFVAVVLFLIGIPAVAAAFTEALGRHKPVSFAYAIGCTDCLVLSAVMRQDEAIYLYMLDPTRAEPWPLRLPWSNETADAIQEAMDGAPEGEEGRFVMRIDPDQDTDPQFHALPQRPALPPKQEPEPGVTYTQPEG